MDELKGGGEIPVYTAGYVIDHSEAMEDVPVPVFTWPLLIREVGAVHLDDSAPGVFGDTVGALYFGGGCDDLGPAVVDPLEALVPNEF